MDDYRAPLLYLSHVDDYRAFPHPPPVEKLEKLEYFQFVPTISDYRELEKTRKKLEVSGIRY